ncbi:MAG: TolC family protein [Myxococcales bacterium]|nr:TolC family protein [Myxococcota bacterium]MDW8282044.1 TolC family protein [Myxococcales bacterium]
MTPRLHLPVSLVLLALPAHAQEPLLPEEVIESVQRAFPLVEAARRDLAAAEGTLLSARGAFDPVLRARGTLQPLGYYRNGRLDALVEQATPLWGLSLFAGYRLALGSYPSYDGKLLTNDEGEVRGGLVLPLLRNGPIDRRRAGIRQAEQGQQAADMGLAQARLEAMRAALLRYWEWVAAGQRYTIARDLLEVAMARDAQVTGRVVRGDLPPIERTENQRAVVQREGAVVAARRQVEQAAIELALYLRGPDGEPVVPPPERLPGTLPEPAGLPSTEVAREAAAAPRRRPEVLRLEALRRQAEIEARWAKNQLWPGLDLVATVSQDFGAGSPTRAPTELELGVVLDLPVPNRTAIGRARAAEATVGRIGAQAQFARDRVTAEVRDALSALEAARQRLALTRQELRIARELEEAERARFELGDSTLLFVNLREQTRYETALREVDALLDYQRAMVSYRAATATLPGMR